MGRAELAAELLLTDDPVRAEKLARELCELNRERQSVEQDIFRRAIEQMEHLPESERSALVLSSEDWHQGVVGIVASRLSEKFSCPSFMIHLSDGSGKGSCRSYGGFNLFNALEACSDLLVSFGGHELAAGFTIEEKEYPRLPHAHEPVCARPHGRACRRCRCLTWTLTCSTPRSSRLRRSRHFRSSSPTARATTVPSSACAAQRSRACRAWARTGT